MVGMLLKTAPVGNIVIEASFDPLSCSDSTGCLASPGRDRMGSSTDFPGAQRWPGVSIRRRFR